MSEDRDKKGKGQGSGAQLPPRPARLPSGGWTVLTGVTDRDPVPRPSSAPSPANVIPMDELGMEPADSLLSADDDDVKAFLADSRADSISKLGAALPDQARSFPGQRATGALDAVPTDRSALAGFPPLPPVATARDAEEVDVFELSMSSYVDPSQVMRHMQPAADLAASGDADDESIAVDIEVSVDDDEADDGTDDGGPFVPPRGVTGNNAAVAATPVPAAQTPAPDEAHAASRKLSPPSPSWFRRPTHEPRLPAPSARAAVGTEAETPAYNNDFASPSDPTLDRIPTPDDMPTPVPAADEPVYAASTEAVEQSLADAVVDDNGPMSTPDAWANTEATRVRPADARVAGLSGSTDAVPASLDLATADAEVRSAHSHDGTVVRATHTLRDSSDWVDTSAAPPANPHDHDTTIDRPVSPELIAAQATIERTPIAPVAFVTAAATPAEPSARPRPVLGATPSPLTEDGARDWATSYEVFRARVQQLARAGRWRDLAAITAWSATNAEWATGTTLTTLLLDLARLYRDRLDDAPLAEEAFAALAVEESANTEALDYLIDVYERRGDSRAVYDLLSRAVEATWDPGERLAWTQRCADLAQTKLDDEGLAIRVWAQLWRLGDAADQAAQALAQLYRSTERWHDLARFLRERVDRAEGADRILLRRELAEVQLVAVRDPAAAVATLREVLAERPNDRPTRAILARLLARSGAFDELARMADDTEIAGFVADALWDAGRHEAAASIYAAHLGQVEDRDRAEHRIREQLGRAGRYAELVNALLEAADESTAPERTGALLDEAAQIAELRLNDAARALEIAERRAAVARPSIADLERIARLAELTGDATRTGSALDALIAAAGSPSARAGYLRKLARLASGPLADDARAERCWRELVGTDPTDSEARDELIALHRRRGNFDALHSALMRQLTLASDAERAETVSRRIAENAESHFADDRRALDAQRRVLDYAPNDVGVWRAVERHSAALGLTGPRIGALERIAALEPDGDARIEHNTQIGEAHRTAGHPRAALAAYERVLRIAPAHAATLAATSAIYAELGDAVAAAAAFEAAAGAEPDQRKALLSRKRDLAVSDLDRTAETRRVALLDGDLDTALSTLGSGTADASALGAQRALLRLSVALAEDPAARRERVVRLAAHLRANSTPREAFALIAASNATVGAEDAELGTLRELAEAAGRVDDLALMLEAVALRSPADRETLTLEAAQLWANALGQPRRAIEAIRATLDAGADSVALLDAIESFATLPEFWREYDEAIVALLDRTDESAARAALEERRERVLGRLADPVRSRIHALTLLRSGRTSAAPTGELDRLLPIAALLADPNTASAALLECCSQLGQSEDLSALAFDISREAVARDPGNADAVKAFEALGKALGRQPEVVDALRIAAALADTSSLKASLLARATGLTADDDVVREELYRRLLDVDPGHIEALEFLITRHRERGESRDLRDRLSLLASITPDASRRRAANIEIGVISDVRLDDAPAAIAAWRSVLAAEPADKEALELLVAMVDRRNDPALQLELRRAELESAEGPRLESLARQVATLQREVSRDEAGARQTLEAAYDRIGATSSLYEDVIAAIETAGDTIALVERILARAAATDDTTARAELVDSALRTVERAGRAVPDALRGAALEAAVAARPGDIGILRRYAAFLRREGRHAELLPILDTLVPSGARIEQLIWLCEKARILGLSSETRDESHAVWKVISHDFFAMPTGPIALARAAADAGDLAAYIGFRREQAARLAPVDAALVLCHLAEVCDEHPEFGIDIADIYREARKLDPANEPAQEALRAIGRRLRTIRPAAALLPEDGERDLSWDERSTRLIGLAEGALFSDPAAALHWGRRAVAVAPDLVAGWEIMAIAAERLADRRTAEAARMGAYGAFLRTTAPSPASLAREAEFAYRAAQADQALGVTDAAGALTLIAHELRPEHAPSAAAVARIFIADGRFDEAELVLDVVVAAQGPAAALPAEISHLRGVIAERRGDTVAARAAYAAALDVRPLYAPALLDRAALDAAAGLTSAAVESLTRGLVSTTETAMRATVYYRLGALLDDRLGAHEEAAACYAAALRYGSTERDLQLRVLRADRRAGRHDRALQVIDRLLETTTEAAELAQLWLDRGLTWLAMGERDESAIEAFDMALSYDAGCHGAREGLATVFERRGDWNQYVQIVDAMTEGGSPEARAAALLRLARVYRDRMSDARRAEEYLRRSVAVEPIAEAVAELETIVAGRDPAGAERQALLAQRATLGPPWYAPMLSLGELIINLEPRRAWCLLAPVLMIRGVDEGLKTRIRDMRRDFERTALLAPTTAARAALLNVLPATRLAISEVFAASSTDAPAVDNALEISAMSSNGRIFAQFAEAAGTPATLARVDDMPTPWRFVRRAGSTTVVVRSDVLQQAARAELGWLLGSLGAWLAPNLLPFAVLTAGELATLVRTLQSDEPPEIDATTLEAARAELAAFDGDAVAALRAESLYAARVLGLVAGADIYQVYRLLSRLEPGLERPGVYATIEQFDDYLSTSALLRELLLAAGSPTFAELMSSAREIAW